MKTIDELGISPAPWKATGGHWVEYGDYAENDMSGAFETFAIPDTEEAPANARLIAAAPELYEACVFALNSSFNCRTCPYERKCTSNKCHVKQVLRSAIAKAGGAE